MSEELKEELKEEVTETESVEEAEAEVQKTVPVEVEEGETETKKTRGKRKAVTVTQLVGDEVTSLALFELGGVKKGVFPFTVLADNNNPSKVVFPELGMELHAYSQDTELVFKDAGSLNTFIINYGQYTELWGWNEKLGVTLKAKGTE